MQEPLATFVHVILPLPLAKLYSYRVPTEMVNDVEPGKRVVVQFGKKKIYSAIIHDVHAQPPANYEAKYILSVLDDDVLVSPTLLNFWDWMAQYYMCSLGDVMQAALPAPFKLESKTRVNLNHACEIESLELSEKEFLIVEALTLQNELSLDEIAEIVQIKNIVPLLKSLYLKDVIVISEEMKQLYKPKTATCLKLSEIYTDEDNLRKLFDTLEKKPKQLDVLMAFLHLKNGDGHIQKNTLIEFSKSNESSLKTLIKNGVFLEYKIQVDRLKKDNTPTETFDLNNFQQQAYDDIQTAFKTKDVALLHGVTSSGKTHVYVRLIEDILKEGKQVLFLLPEIALTSQIVHRIKKYFGDNAVAFHSKFSQNERVELWDKIKSGEAKIVIGARSAVFLPFQKLGLVIVDEEHETSYKQQDPAPRYHARDAAIFLSHLWKCKTILGSATPSFESYYNCKTEKYALIEMKERFNKVDLPKIITANIAEETRVKTMKENFTSVLFHEIEKALSLNEQIILFQNRRGYAPVLECQVCRWVPKCVNCDISLTYHKSIDSLKCHYCGHTQNLPKSCPACGSNILNLKGIGTEKIEDELAVLFPDARVSRLDLDSSKTKHGHEQIIQNFENHEADILVGTQMIGKGLDFEKVSVVGIINADQLIYFPDFRAHERAYQLISQVSGRAGRREKQGKVVIQTSSPNHPVINEIIQHGYENLYANEIVERKNFNYPPFTRMIKIVVKHHDYKTAAEASFVLKNNLQNKLGDNIIGPESPHVSKIRNMYIKEMLIKIDRNSTSLNEIKKFIKRGIENVLEIESFKRSIIFSDVDPF